MRCWCGRCRNLFMLGVVCGAVGTLVNTLLITWIRS